VHFAGRTRLDLSFIILNPIFYIVDLFKSKTVSTQKNAQWLLWVQRIFDHFGLLCLAVVLQNCGAPTTSNPDGGGSANSSPPSSAVPSDGSCLFNSATLGNHQSVTAYTISLVGFGESCSTVEEALTCQNGSLVNANGTVTNNDSPTCRAAKTTTCSFLNFATSVSSTLTSGQSLTGYSAISVPESQTCASVQTTVGCQNGVLTVDGKREDSSGYALNPACNVGACGTTLDGSSTTKYTAGYLPFGQSCDSVKVTVTCQNQSFVTSNGIKLTSLTPVCTVAPTANCGLVNLVGGGFSGLTIQNGQTLSGYDQASVTAGDACANHQETIACSNGFISVNGGTPISESNIASHVSYSATCN